MKNSIVSILIGFTFLILFSSCEEEEIVYESIEEVETFKTDKEDVISPGDSDDDDDDEQP